MALKGSFKNPHNNNMLADAYLKIVKSEDDVFEKVHVMQVYIYESEQARDGENPATPIRVLTYVAAGDDYSAYFSEDILKQENKTARTQEYAFLKELPEFAGWENC